MAKKRQAAVIDYKLLEEPYMAKQALEMLQKTKTELDDFVDTLELLSDPQFKKNLDRGLKEASERRTERMSIEDLRKRIQR